MVAELAPRHQPIGARIALGALFMKAGLSREDSPVQLGMLLDLKADIERDPAMRQAVMNAGAAALASAPRTDVVDHMVMGLLLIAAGNLRGGDAETHRRRYRRIGADRFEAMGVRLERNGRWSIGHH